MPLLTKLKAARYELEGLEKMISKLWSSSKVQYDKDAALGIHHWDPNLNSSTEQDMRYLKEIVVRCANQKEYVFNEADFSRLHLNDIEDMLLLYVKNKLHHLKGNEQVDLINALRVFTRRIVLKKRVKDVQLGVENVVYLNKSNRKYRMRDDELYKFSDVTLKSVRDTLNPMLHNFVLGYHNEGMSNRAWSEKDQKRTTSMLKKINDTLLERRIMKSLERFVDRRRVETDYRLLTLIE
ncbi:hypothetical protein Tco_0658955 [Tanacetum coccineum]